jgi:hypothetical protein
MAYLCWLVIKSYGFRSVFGSYHFVFGLFVVDAGVLRLGLMRICAGVLLGSLIVGL